MPPICAWVLDEALGQAARWQELPAAPGVFVNLAAHQVDAAAPPGEIARLASAHGVEPGRICLEVSEQMLDRDAPVIRERLLELRAHGSRWRSTTSAPAPPRRPGCSSCR